MNDIFQGLKDALLLIVSLDAETVNIAVTSVQVSLASCLIATFIGFPTGFILGRYSFPFRNLLASIVNTLMAMPTVTIGLIFFSVLSRKGPLGNLDILFTKTAIVIGQSFLAFPIITGLSMASIREIDSSFFKTVKTLGFSAGSEALLLLRELRYQLSAAVIAAYGRVIAEVGISMMLGGNIKGLTRTMTTAIALETSKGEFARGIALGLILLAIAFIVNISVNILGKRN